MSFSLQRKILLPLLLVTLIALSSGVLLRSFIIRDFKAFAEGRSIDRLYQVLAVLEGRFAEQNRWQAPVLANDLIWAHQMGFEIRLYDHQGQLLITTDQALSGLPPLMRKRISASTEGRPEAAPDDYHPYPLFLQGQEIGLLEVRIPRPIKEELFIRSSNLFLLYSTAGMGLLAVLLSVLLARRLSRPLQRLTTAAEGIASGDLGQRVPLNTNDEIGRLATAFNTMADSLEGHERLRKQLVSNAAHELRTPLMVIRGELEGMLDGVLPSSPEALQSLHQETGRLTAILDGVDELSRAEASFLSLQREEVQLKLLCEGIATRFGRLAEDKQARIVVACPDGLTVWADPDRLSQILINLLTNALKALPDQGRVELRATETDQTAVIELSDNGHGISPELLPHIFERFYKGAQGGLGLGLAIVRELVAAHNGTIEVDSEPGRGTTFILRLPKRHKE
ncbi:HAMP domain-containing sensor histidine kinase [Trichlorobacter sp.]|uniref:sensor histidine kinase n=1 Tax=Trichlorobacter sp. TaxID=2911007 RepID=UPI002A36367E|nr:HAMP domain-containing sensor histidine kinase [Trichlorobacter sp.]MDY0385438.1 HAMP domain-containing sensor histidine kinase [Trichlorobacter sp.]